MQYVLPVILVSVGALLGMFAFLLFWETRKTKNAMNQRDKKGNVLGSVFLFIVASALIMGGVSTWYSTNKTVGSVDQYSSKAPATAGQAAEIKENQPKGQEQTSAVQTNAQENTKQQAERAYKSFSQIQKSFDYLILSYQTAINDISNGNTGTSSDSDLDKLNQQTKDLFRSIQDMDVANQYVNYKELMVTSILYLQGSIEDLKSFVEEKKVNRYTEAQDFLEKSLEANKLANLGVSNQAVIDGYTPPQDK